MKLRKIIAAIITGVMFASLLMGNVVFADETPALDGSWPETTVKIGVVNLDTTTEAYAYGLAYCNYLAKHFNIEFIMSEAVDTTEQEISFIESCAAAGCAGIIGWRNVGGAAIIKLCDNKGLKYWMATAEEAVISRYGTNPAFLGYNEAGENADFDKGYSWGKALADAGCHKVVYMSGGADFGVSIFVNRRDGFYAAIEDAKAEGVDIEVIYEINTWPDSDAYAAMQDTAIAMDPDGVADSVGADYWIQPLNAAGKLDGSLKFATNIELSENYIELYDMGLMAAGVFPDTTISYIAPAIPMIINAVNGHEELTKLEDGNAVPCYVPYWNIESYEQVEALVSRKEAEDYFMTAEMLSQFFPEFNSDASIELYQDVFASMTLEKVLGDN